MVFLKLGYCLRLPVVLYSERAVLIHSLLVSLVRLIAEIDVFFYHMSLTEPNLPPTGYTL